MHRSLSGGFSDNLTCCVMLWTFEALWLGQWLHSCCDGAGSNRLLGLVNYERGVQGHRHNPVVYMQLKLLSVSCHAGLT